VEHARFHLFDSVQGAVDDVSHGIVLVGGFAIVTRQQEPQGSRPAAMLTRDSRENSISRGH